MAFLQLLGAVLLAWATGSVTLSPEDTDREQTHLLQLSKSSARGPNPACPGPACGAPGCPGFFPCPEHFPLPYDGEYPEAYPFSAGHEFPAGFHWGLGTAAYQIEGAYNEDGRGASIWDTFSGANTVGMPGSVCKSAPCPVSSLMGVKGATGNVANDSYHKYKQDIAMMSSMGVKHYRFSISWPRMVPTGVVSDGINPKAVKFYHDVIEELLDHAIEPIITMYHWDLPQGLLDFDWNSKIPTCNAEYRQGWYECVNGTDGMPVPSGLDGFVVEQFYQYAKYLLAEYGSRVKYWFTFNEAWTFTYLASGSRGKAPNVQPWMDPNVWPYVAGHNVILAHARVANHFRELQKNNILSAGYKISITNNQDWREPRTNSPQDIAAAQYSLEGQLGWFCDPIYGVDGVHDYPESMRRTLPYMPKFTLKEQKLLQSSRPDMFGLNHYGTAYVRYNCTGSGLADSSCTTEEGLPMAVSPWLFQAGWGFRKILNWVALRYGKDLPIWGTESGWSDNSISALQGKYDAGRTAYYYAYISEMWKAIHLDHVRVEAFMAWSLMDNYEWEQGFAERFGCLWNEFNFGSDPNAPGPATPIYHAEEGVINDVCGAQCGSDLVGIPSPNLAYNQTRHVRNSIMWLQWVWETNMLVNPEQFITGSIGGDVCYGEGTYKGVPCALSSSIPGPAPSEAWR